MTRARRGVALAELLVALVLAALLSAAAAAALTGAERHVRRAMAASEDWRALHDAELILRAELRAASADSVRLRGDTAVEFLGLVGTSVACVTAGGVLVLPPADAASGLPYSQWRATPESGDLVVAFDTSRGGTWTAATVDSVVSRTDGANCVPASGLLSVADSVARLPVLRLTLERPLARGAIVGSPVRVLRRARYVLLRGADRQWTLSYRRCSLGGACGASQPVVGPLASAADSGLAFSLDALAPSLDIGLRAPLREPGVPRAALRSFIALPNRATANP